MIQPPQRATANTPLPLEHYQALIDGVLDYAIFMLDPQGRVSSWNQGSELITGYAADEILGLQFSKFYPPKAIEQMLPDRELELARDTGRCEADGWRQRKDGGAFWANVLITRMNDANGQLVGFSTITRDLTDRHKQELSLRQSEERFRLLIAGVKDYAIFMLDPQGIVSTWNAGAEYIKGYKSGEIIGSHFSRFYPPEAIARRLPETELRGATMQGRFEDEGWRVKKDGDRFWANVIITAVRDASGRLLGFSKITRDLSERRVHEEELRRSEERFRLLVDGVTEYAIIMLDSDGFVTSWNSGAEKIKGYKSAEVLGRHVSHFYPAEAILDNRPWEDLRTARDQGRIVGEGWSVRKDGTLFWASTVVSALHDPDGHLYGFAKVTQDLTQRRHSESLADTAQRMHEFIAMLAHELRNPLSPIRNAVALMARKGLNDPVLEAMRQTIDRQSIQLTRLLDELLDVNRIARGQFTIRRERLDVREVIHRAVESARPLIEARKHHIDVEVPDAAVFIDGDPVRLTQAIVNLLNNAAKYTADAGRIRLLVATRNSELEIRIRDSGKGIERAKLEQVFELFVQLEPNTNSALGGLGVGLALVRRVIELHGGSVQARSEGQGKGSEFIARLPISSNQAKLLDFVKTSEPDDVPQIRVLVVDDNHDAGDSLGLLLESMGNLVHTVYDGPSAIAAAKTFQPALILLDIGMPGMNGYEVAESITANSHGATPILIAVTGWGQAADKERARVAGFQHHFVKPISEEALANLLVEAANRSGPTA